MELSRHLRAVIYERALTRMVDMPMEQLTVVWFEEAERFHAELVAEGLTNSADCLRRWIDHEQHLLNYGKRKAELGA